MNKHTPGPWEILHGKFVPIEIADDSQMYIVRSDHCELGLVCSWLNDPETLKEARANAYLIAAAPDLLAALEAKIELTDEIRSAGAPPHTDYWHQSIFMVEQQMRAAIARAKGESK